MADDIVMYVFWSVTGFVSLQKRPFLLALRRLGRFVSFRNIPSGEVTDVFAGYGLSVSVSLKKLQNLYGTWNVDLWERP